MLQKLKIASLLTAVAAAPLLLSVPAAADEGGSKFSEVQKLGYLGKTSKSALTRSVLERMQSLDTAPALAGPADRVKFWHSVLLNSIALDHTPDPDTGSVPFVQGGPGRTSRALAMTMIPVFDAANSFAGEYNSYNDVKKGKPGASMDAAIATAAHAMLVELFPYQKTQLDSLLASDLSQITASPNGIAEGQKVGASAAKKMIQTRKHDNSNDDEPSFGGGGVVADGSTNYFGNPINGGTQAVGEWTPDPNTPEFSGDFNLSLGAFWGGVTPFTLASGDQFRLPEPPEIGSAEFIAAFDEVAAIGGSPDNANTTSTSTPDTRFVGNFWGYDAVPLLGTPPRAYNQIAVGIATQEGVTDPVELARILAMVNTGLADSGIAAWDSKWFYNWWRPVTGVRRDDGVAETTNDPTWDPVGVSILNVDLGDNAFIRPTPPFPAYPSGHATFCASMTEILTAFFGDDTAYEIVSDEYNGEGVDPFNGAPRPLVPVLFDTLTDIRIDNGISRVYNGVHWSYDNLQGQELGINIAENLLNNVAAFQPAN